MNRHYLINPLIQGFSEVDKSNNNQQNCGINVEFKRVEYKNSPTSIATFIVVLVNDNFVWIFNPDMAIDNTYPALQYDSLTEEYKPLTGYSYVFNIRNSYALATPVAPETLCSIVYKENSSKIIGINFLGEIYLLPENPEELEIADNIQVTYRAIN